MLLSSGAWALFHLPAVSDRWLWLPALLLGLVVATALVRQQLKTDLSSAPRPRERVVAEELRQGAGDGLGVLDVEEVADAVDRAVLDVGE